MQFITNTKYLYKMLKSIDFSTEGVQFVESTERSIVNIVTNKKTIHLKVEVDNITNKINQQNRRWDWVKQTCKLLDDQPIVISCEDNRLRLSVDY